VLFSLDKATQPLLDAQVAGHTMRKRYLAVVAGRTAWESRVVDAPMGRDRHDSRRMRVCRPGQGKPAQTRVRRLAAAGGRTLLVVELGSGRRHQIRVHLASLGFPIVGDVLYGGARSKGGSAPARVRGGARPSRVRRAPAAAYRLARAARLVAGRREASRKLRHCPPAPLAIPLCAILDT
jgi:23S rRNA-/tRNA-specific pseudouridylate synthase